MNESENTKFDVAIVGAGPAGSSCAIRLVEKGFKVLLVEQKQFPRSKLCGEFISPECLGHFAELGVLSDMELAGGVALESTVFYARNGRSVAVPSEWFSGTKALGLSRAAMDLSLLSRARKGGVCVMEQTHAAGLLWDGDRVCGVKLTDQFRTPFTVDADLVIDATGRARILAGQIERSNRIGGGERAGFVAFKTHLSGAGVADGVCEIYAYRGGYGGCSRVENDVYNLCFIVPASSAKRFGGNAAAVMQNEVFANKRAAQTLGNVEVVDDWLAVPIQRYGRSQLAPAQGLLTIGDAAAFIDPFTGSGILLALESAKVAASVIGQYDAPLGTTKIFNDLAGKYNRHYAEAFDRRLRYSSLLRRAAFVPFFAETVIKGLSLSDRVTHRLAMATRPGKQIDSIR